MSETTPEVPEPTSDVTPEVSEPVETPAPSPADVTNFPEDDDPESNVGDVVEGNSESGELVE